MSGKAFRSFSVPAWLVSHRVLAFLTPAALRVLLAIAGHANHGTGTAWPGVNTIAAQTGLSRRAVFTAIAGLERVGLVKIDHGGGARNTNEYRIAETVNATSLFAAEYPRNEALSAKDAAALAAAIKAAFGEGTSKRRGETRRTVKPGAPNGEAGAHGTVKPASPEHHQGNTTKNTSILPRRESKASDGGKGTEKTGAGSKVFSLLHDDDGQKQAADALLVELPDSADPDAVKAALVRRGVHGGRAYKLALRASPAVVRSVLAQAGPHLSGVAKPGAYIAGLLDDALERAEAERLAPQAAALAASIEAQADAEKKIGAMNEAEFRTVLAKMAAEDNRLAADWLAGDIAKARKSKPLLSAMACYLAAQALEDAA